MKFKLFQAILTIFLQASSIFAYDREAAVEYADKWTSNIDGEKRNPKYHDFSYYGGDCTNYISQCLIDKEGGWLRFTSSQGYIKYPKEGCLIRAGELPGALINFHGVEKKSTITQDAEWPNGKYHLPSFAKKGDVISVSVPKKSYFHSTILVEVSGDKGKIDAHPNDHFHFDIDGWAGEAMM